MLDSSQSTVSENPTSTANSVTEKSTDGSPPNRKCQGKVPKKIHKAEREKLKRDQLNDLFLELGNLLESDRQNSGKASILGDTTRILRDLLSQVECLRKENAALQTESRYVTTEKNELKDENTALQTQITELQNELQARMGYDHPVWTNRTDSLSRLATPHPAISIQPPHHHNRHHPQPLAQPPPAVIGLVCPTPPRELQLFPVSEPAREEGEAPSNVRRPHARYPASLDSWPGQLLHTSLVVTRTPDEQCSSSGLTLTTNTLEENPR
ncbi:transcription factor bHLH47-like [Ananas comosus]|uniref:Transcription factor bHLH47-like n=1 Tax=Ananas comosus TaxID=4615 RepID=A0A6P5FW18_ANACO|nr:transcription factor bHLH47-like [Ananas comosus]XP_020099858.1 transcription factor bHLH47-like [Ananas comosus]